MKTFIEIINLAEEKGWCMKPFCTTCGSREFRDELRKLSEEYESGLVDALCATSLSALQNSLNWKDAVRVSLEEINDEKGMDKVLKSWLPNLKENIKLADLVLFYFVKGGIIFARMSVEVLNKWVDECKRLAIMTENESLLESLIYTLETSIGDDKELREVIDRKLTDSEKIKRAFLFSIKGNASY